MNDEPARSNDRSALRHALAYAWYGWPVFPCKPGTKEPATRHGFKDATTNPERIAAWWNTAPACNIAIATGAPGPDVLDVDVRPGGSGYPAYNRLRRVGLVRGSLALVATPSGGLHAYYQGSGQRGGRLAGHHLDFKAVGGYVLAPPSRVGGTRYQLVQRQASASSLDWAAVVRHLDPPGRRQRIADRSERAARSAGNREPVDSDRLAAWVAGLPEGNRNAGLFWAACRLAESGRADLLAVFADAARVAGLSRSEISRTLASARRTSAQPRSAGAVSEHAAGIDAEAAS